MTARRSIVVVLSLAAPAGLAAATASPGAEPPYNARCGDRDCQVEETPANWALAGVGSDRRTLQITYEIGGCARADGWAIVRETADSIQIETRQHTVVTARGDSGPEPVACPADLGVARLRARLAHPIGGRRVEGGPRLSDAAEGLIAERRQTPHGGVVLVPRVIGLSPGDAVDVLGGQSFHARTIGDPGGRVAAQRPRPGARVRLEGKRVPGTVSLRIERVPRRLPTP